MGNEVVRIGPRGQFYHKLFCGNSGCLSESVSLWVARKAGYKPCPCCFEKESTKGKA